MTREEAIQAIKEKMDYYESDKRLRGAIETLFPELHESEDERIREFLIDLLSHGTWKKDWPFSPPECVAWLEKQKEPHYTKRNALFDKCVENCDPKVMKEVSDKVDEMLQKEQKPAEWSEEDENVLKYLHELIGYGYVRKFMDAQTATDMKEWLNTKLKSLRPRWKPSEVQMEALEYVIRDYREDSCNATANYLQEILDHLKNM